MTARFSIFKDNTKCTEPATNGVTVAPAMVQAESRLGTLPLADKHYPNSVVNEASVRRGHDIQGGRSDGY